VHLQNPRDVVPESNMPNYPWLAKTKLAPADIVPKMRALQRLGVPYTDEQIARAPDEIKGKSEQDAMVAYLQNLGLALRNLK
jgi:cytochrome c oxidase cbb3-type subunit 2